jgi:hypothetical protein
MQNLCSSSACNDPAKDTILWHGCVIKLRKRTEHIKKTPYVQGVSSGSPFLLSRNRQDLLRRDLYIM